MLPVEVKQDDSGFSSHTMNKCFCHLLSAAGFCFFFFTFLCYSAKELSSVSKRKKAVTCLTGKTDLPHNFPLTSSIVLMAMSSLLINQQCIP